MNSTVVMVLVFMGILVLISSFFIFYTVRLQHKEVLDAERKNNKELSNAVLAAQTAYKTAEMPKVHSWQTYPMIYGLL